MAGVLKKMTAQTQVMSVDEHTRLGAQLLAVKKQLTALEQELLARRFELTRDLRSPATKLAYALKSIGQAIERAQTQGDVIAETDHPEAFSKTWYQAPEQRGQGG